jgi:hypothetical protein
MSVKSVSFTILSNGLGAVPQGAGNTIAVIGVAESGTDDQAVQSSSPRAFPDANGYGPGPQAAAFVAQFDGNDVILVKAATVTSGTVSAVSHTGTGASVMTITGTPLDTYYLVVTPTVAGTIGVAGCQATVSLDAGRTIYSTITFGVATTYLIPNTGLTLNFTAASLVVDDTYTAVAIEPKWSTGTLISAMDGLLASGLSFKNVLVAGDLSASEAASVKAEMTTYFNKKRFNRVFTNARDVLWGGTSTETEAQWVTALLADYSGFEGDRLSVAAGFYNLISPLSQTQFRRPISWAAAALDSAASIGQDISAVAPNGTAEPIPMVAKPTNPDGFDYYNAQENAALDTARFLTGQLIYGLPGWYMTNSNLMSAAGSDFSILPYGEVVDEVCRISYIFFTQFLGGSVRVSATTGFILASDANDIDSRCTTQLETGLGNGVSGVRCLVTRNNNILATKVLIATIQVIPLGYINAVDVTVTFVNPAIIPVAA